MQLHELRPIHKKKSKKRVGRGGKRGTYSGKGVKGQKSRAGHKIRPAIRDFIKQIPKMRGYRFNVQEKQAAIVNLRDIAKKYKEGEIVSPGTLLEKRLVRRMKGRVPQVKILGEGELKVSLRFKNVRMSKSVHKKLNQESGIKNQE